MPRHKKNLIRLIGISLTAFSLVGCAGIARPKGFLCVAHLADPNHGIPHSYNHCFDLEQDFDDDGKLKPTAKGQKLPLIMDKHVNMDPKSFSSLNAYLQKIRERYKQCLANGG